MFNCRRDLYAPDNLTTIGGNLYIATNPNLTHLTGLENVTTVGNFFRIGNTLEDNFPDFSNLTSVGRLLAIGLNPNVTYLNFQNVSGSLTQSFQIAGNPSLIQVDAPINLTAVGEDLTFSANPNLTTINGVENVASIGQYLYIDQNGITDLLDFSSVTSVGRAIYIASNPNITSIDIRNVSGVIGLGPAYDLSGIFIVNNSLLSSLAAPEPLSTVNGFISINANPNLSTFTGLGNVNSVGRTLWLSGIAESHFPDMLNLSTIGEMKQYRPAGPETTILVTNTT